MQDSVVAWELQSWERHILNVPFLTSIVLPSFHDAEILLGEEDKVLGIDVTLFSLFCTLAGLVQLWLQIRAGVVRRVILWIWHITPTGCQLKTEGAQMGLVRYSGSIREE